jgi:hypothetical protein
MLGSLNELLTNLPLFLTDQNAEGASPDFQEGSKVGFRIALCCALAAAADSVRASAGDFTSSAPKGSSGAHHPTSATGTTLQ